ncbi:pilus assembly protein PilM [Romboutsia ilealis]|nr:pilus assembly protein PilM [Romboutsia ilealis]
MKKQAKNNKLILRSGTIKKIINIEITKSYVRVIFLRQDMKNIYIDDDIQEDISLNISNEIIGNTNKYYINDTEKEKYVENITKIIESKIYNTKKFTSKYKSILYNIQTEDVIIRMIDNVNISNKSDILGLIKFNINQYMHISVDDYVIEYKIINQINKMAKIQVILFPKYLIDLCKSISKNLKIKSQIINVNYDILQKLIELNLITNLESNSLFIENRNEEILFNKVIDKKICESYILSKNEQYLNYINNLDEKIDKVYYYGIEDKSINNEINSFSSLNVSPLNLENNKRSIIISNQLGEDLKKYINAIGMII